MSQYYNHNELDSILQTLAKSTQSAQTIQSAPPDLAVLPGPRSFSREPRDRRFTHDEYDPSSLPLVPALDEARGRYSLQHSHNSTASDNRVQSIDPREIIAWKPALRHVTSLVSRQPALQERIRKLIQAQHNHEKQWWQGREALIKQQAGRDEGRKKLGELLKNVGGNIDASIAGPTPVEDAEELQRYDIKVHDAMTKMEEDYAAQLAAIGVPFFKTRSEYIAQPYSARDREATASTGDNAPSGAEDKQTITQSMLNNLQRRMIGLLEDLCAD